MEIAYILEAVAKLSFFIPYKRIQVKSSTELFFVSINTVGILSFKK